MTVWGAECSRPFFCVDKTEKNVYNKLVRGGASGDFGIIAFVNCENTDLRLSKIILHICLTALFAMFRFNGLDGG